MFRNIPEFLPHPGNIAHFQTEQSEELPILYKIKLVHIVLHLVYFWHQISVTYQLAFCSGFSLIRIIHLSGTSLGAIPHSSIESDSLIRKFSYPNSQTGNSGVRISEVPLYIRMFLKFDKSDAI